MKILDLLNRMHAQNASDLFLSVGKPPTFRIAGRIEDPEGDPILLDDLREFLQTHLPSTLWERLPRERDLDVGVSLSSGQRYRLNFFYQKGQLSSAIRRVPSGALDMEELLLPPVLRTLAEAPRGLVLITGPTGCGKSTTLAAMLHHINAQFRKHIITVEDPIEFVHQDILSMVSQREVGTDTMDFNTALRHVVRQNPDVIIIGEMRDLESIRTAISASLTGHLVLTTMHTVDTAQTLERLLSYFPAEQQEQMALDLSISLVGIVSQRLLQRSDTRGLVPAVEVLTATPRVRKLIADRNLDEILEAIKAGGGDGMQTFTQSLVDRCRRNLVTAETAAAAATNRDEFLLAIEGMQSGIDTLRVDMLQTVGNAAQNMKRLLRAAVRNLASDLILSTGSPPLLRIQGQLVECELPALSATDAQKLVFSILSTAQRIQLESEREIDFALSVSGLFPDDTASAARHRFRVNAFYQRSCVACALRLIPQIIPTAKELGLPQIILDLANAHQGLVLVVGPTGQGKTTTLARLVEEINTRRACHIITVEDPIEYVHMNQRSVIEQRELNSDTKSFANAMKYVLRQNPDVILVGEMRDLETMSAALTAAETGHLVFSTLHTNDSAQTVDRIVDMFPDAQQNQIRLQLASCLLAVISQRLLPKKGDENHRIAAFEIMLGTHPIRALIRDRRTHQILSTIQTSFKEGMIPMEKSLSALYDKGLIDQHTYEAYSRNLSTTWDNSSRT
jgi:pilus retraction protein PilT